MLRTFPIITLLLLAVAPLATAGDRAIEIRKRWDNDSQNIWSFDGKVLKRQWHNDSKHEWLLIGNTLQPRWGTPAGNNIWSFDGKNVRNQSINRSDDDWVFEKNILRKMWGGNNNPLWEFDGRLLRPLWHKGDEWEASANVPLLIMLKAAGII